MELPGGKFTVRRRVDGAVRIECPPIMVVRPADAVEMAKALLKVAGVETVFTDPGQTVIKPPRRKVGDVLKFGGY
jgi:hypothetical protein